MSDSDIETLFQKICREKPAKSHLQAFRDHADRQEVIDFLVDKLDALRVMSLSNGEWDNELEWGGIHACELLGEFKAKEAALPMIEVLDDVKDNCDLLIHNAAACGLEGMGVPALEPAYRRYERDRADDELASLWLWVLASLGVKEERIRVALLEHMKKDQWEAVMMMGDYGDVTLLPTVEESVQRAAAELNELQIDPFAPGGRFERPAVSEYIDGRESLVILKEGMSVDHPDFDAKIQELDRQLLKYTDFSVYERQQKLLDSIAERVTKVGRNDPCPCGSGKKFKHCCERL